VAKPKPREDHKARIRAAKQRKKKFRKGQVRLWKAGARR
jgi:hypothetical protein